MEGKRAHQLSTQPSRGSQQRTNLCQIDINLLPIPHLVKRSPSCGIPFLMVHFYQTQVISLPCLVSQLVSESLFFLNFAQIVGFVKIDTWISLSLLYEFVKLATYMVLSWICQNWYMDLHNLALQNKTNVWPGFQSLLKFLLQSKGVGWVKILNALGQLCLWQCLI